MTQIDRWTTASSNCLGYAPEDGELVKYEDHRAVVDGLEARVADLERVVLLLAPCLSGIGDQEREALAAAKPYISEL